MIVTINGKTVECEPGEYLLGVAERNGIHIPSLCNHEGLGGQGCCRICIVEVEAAGGHRDIVAACVYPIERDCAIFTDSDRIRRHRRMVLALLRARAAESDEIADLCDKYSVQEYGRFTALSGSEKCILCGLCVKACDSLGTGAISTVSRGVDKKVSTPYDEPALVCVGCGSCASVCPTNAITMTEDETTRTIWNKEFDLAKCKRCGAVIGTAFEHYRAANRIDAKPTELCTVCRKKAPADIMATTFAR